jgi:hypothetical protein
VRNASRFSVLEAAAVAAMILMFAAGVSVLHWVFRDPDATARQQRLDSLARLAEHPPASLTFSRGPATRTVDDSGKVAEFLELIVRAEPVPRHHSHPQEPIRLQLAGHGTVYLLGRDSQVADEHWLQIDEGDGSPTTLGLFRSEALVSWLLRHGFTTAETPDR